MAKKKGRIPQYGTITLKGTEYYRTRILDADGKQVSLYALTNLLYAGVDPKTVQYLAGHENSKTTMDIYAKVKYNKPEDLCSVVNEALGQ